MGVMVKVCPIFLGVLFFSAMITGVLMVLNLFWKEVLRGSGLVVVPTVLSD